LGPRPGHRPGHRARSSRQGRDRVRARLGGQRLPDPPAPPASPSGGPVNGPRILVVEDDGSIATGLALNLKLEGYQAEVVGDGEAALAAVAARPPDLILLDLSLPGKDGLAVLAELRRAGDTTPIVVLSAREGEFDKV